MGTKKILLAIMDGWGLGQVKSSDAIQHANTPFVSSLYQKYPLYDQLYFVNSQ